MVIRQSYNRKIKAWVKYKYEPNKKNKILNVKQADPMKPFKGVRKRGQVRLK